MGNQIGLVVNDVDVLPADAMRMRMAMDNREIWITVEAETQFAALRVKYSKHPDWQDDPTYNLKKRK